MSKVSGEQLDSAKRGGFLLGMAIAELMVLVLLALVLFLTFREKEYEDKDKLLALAGGEDTIKVIVDAIAENSGGAELFNNPELIETIVAITTREILSGNNGDSPNPMIAVVEENKELKEANDALEAARQSLLDQMLAMTAGETTLCVYTPSTDLDKIRGGSVPIGIVRLEGEGIEILKLGYPSQSKFVTYDGLDYVDTTDGILTEFREGQVLRLAEFRELSQRLAANGDEYRTDSRSNCRHYFNYYFDSDRVTADFTQRFGLLNYSGVRLSERDLDNLDTDNALSDEESAALLKSQEKSSRTEADPVESIDFINANIDYKPLEEPKPRYPLSARREGLEGSVLLQFAVNERGEVIEESIEIIETSDTRFDRSATEAISNAKFLPRIVAGRAEIVRNIRYKITYVLVN